METRSGLTFRISEVLPYAKKFTGLRTKVMQENEKRKG